MISANDLLPLPSVLRQTISNLIIVTFFRDKDMHRQRGLGWPIKDAHRNRCPVMVDRVPEQC